MPVNALNPDHDDAHLCVERMKPELQKLIDQRLKPEALLSAMTTAFAELLRERGGNDEPLARALAAFTGLPIERVPRCEAVMPGAKR